MEKKKFKVISNVQSLLPSQFDEYEQVKTDLRKYGFVINDETNEIQDPSDPVELTWDQVIKLDLEFYPIVDYRRMEIEFRLK